MTITKDPTVPSMPPSPEPFISMAMIPNWLITHPELRKRGIMLERPLQPFTIYATDYDFDGPSRVVKAINPSSRHTIPHEIVHCERPLLIMPYASPVLKICKRTTSSILAAFDQILEGVEHLHRLRIAHGMAKRHPQLTAGRVYLIDFESSQQFEHGPGVQTAVPLPNTHVNPPLGMKSLNLFSWDVFCLGRMLEYMV
uniref:N/A n=1 Tax=Ganoderma boninense TaxID=34458 RepID=A0A5K1JTL2_9APHY|nr:N/A [Ganoderma boninense]